MTTSYESQGMSTGEIVDTEVEEEETRRGRGRPPGSVNRNTDYSSDISEIRAELTALRSSIESLRSQVVNVTLQTSTPDLPPNLEIRLDTIQTWVETLHLFLNTGRITNSVDGAAETALEEIIGNIPEVPSHAT